MPRAPSGCPVPLFTNHTPPTSPLILLFTHSYKASACILRPRPCRKEEPQRLCCADTPGHNDEKSQALRRPHALIRQFQQKWYLEPAAGHGSSSAGSSHSRKVTLSLSPAALMTQHVRGARNACLRQWIAFGYHLGRAASPVCRYQREAHLSEKVSGCGPEAKRSEESSLRSPIQAASTKYHTVADPAAPRRYTRTASCCRTTRSAAHPIEFPCRAPQLLAPQLYTEYNIPGISVAGAACKLRQRRQCRSYRAIQLAVGIS